MYVPFRGAREGLPGRKGDGRGRATGGGDRLGDRWSRACPRRGEAADPAEQIAELQAIKRSLSPGERKLDSRMAVDARRPRSRLSGLTEVDIARRATRCGPVERLRALGATVRYASPRTGDVRAARPASASCRRSRAGARSSASSAAAGYPQRPLRRPQRESKAERGARVEAALQNAAALVGVTSEGDRAHAADTARADPTSPASARSCARSRDGVDSLAASQAAGELPAVDVLPSRPATATRARRCSRSCTTSRPGAELGFATAFISAATLRRQHPRAALRRRLRRDRRRHPLLQRVARSRTARSPRRSTPSPPTARCTSARPATRATRSTAPPATTRATSAAPGGASASSPARRTTSIPARACRCSSR